MINQNTIEESNQYYPNANIKVKDRLFRFVFQKKEDLLDLYNAVNNSAYNNIDDLEVNTLEDAVYLSMKNDISFLIGGTMNLYEHQSTYNPNMPIRGLMYLMTLYKQYIDGNNINVYGAKLQKLPYPQYIVFYNGEKRQPDRVILKLSDAFDKIEGKEPSLECKAIMLNINYGHNRSLMEKCARLEEYAIFIAMIRKYQRDFGDINRAVNVAVDECIEKDILKDILMNQRAEVVSMLLTTFNQEVYEKGVRAEGYEDGYESGLLEGSIKTYIEDCREFSVPKESALPRLMEKFSMDREEAEKALKKFWK